MRSPFLGAYDVGRSTNSVDSQLTNLYLQVIEGGAGKAPGALYQTPGLTLFATCGDGPINGMRAINGSLNVISNNAAYFVAADGTVTANGTLGSDPISSRVSFISTAGEGSSGPTQTYQLAAFTDVGAWISTGGNFSAITLPAELTKPGTPTSQDTFGLVNQRGTNIWWQSDSLDLTTWDELNFTFADALPSEIVAIQMFNRQIWILKTDSIEIWVDQGSAGFAFARLDGPFSHYGCAAPLSVDHPGDSLMWLSRTDEGQAQVLQARGYQPVRVSNSAVEREFASYDRIDDAFAYDYQQDGHIFYVITFPSANATWCYDVTTSDALRTPVWHRRGLLNQATGSFDRHPGNCYAFFNGMHLIGDYRSGKIYALDFSATTDAGTRRKWVRTWRAMAEPILQPRRFDALQIDMQTGIGVPAADNPQVSLRWSDDGGHTWSNYRQAAAGAQGATAKRVLFRRLGSTKRNSGLDRIFELSSSDVFAVGLIGADVSP